MTPPCCRQTLGLCTKLSRPGEERRAPPSASPHPSSRAGRPLDVGPLWTGAVFPSHAAVWCVLKDTVTIVPILTTGTKLVTVPMQRAGLRLAPCLLPPPLAPALGAVTIGFRTCEMGAMTALTAGEIVQRKTVWRRGARGASTRRTCAGRLAACAHPLVSGTEGRGANEPAPCPRGSQSQMGQLDLK